MKFGEASEASGSCEPGAKELRQVVERRSRETPAMQKKDICAQGTCGESSDSSLSVTPFHGAQNYFPSSSRGGAHYRSLAPA